MDVTQLADALEEMSQAYARRYGIERDANWFVLKLLEEAGELVQSYLMLSGKARTGMSPRSALQYVRKRARWQGFRAWRRTAGVVWKG